MKQAFEIVQLIMSVALIVLVMLQVRGTGFGRSANSTSFTRRGIEKLVFKLTFVIAALFIVTSIIVLFV